MKKELFGIVVNKPSNAIKYFVEKSAFGSNSYIIDGKKSYMSLLVYVVKYHPISSMKDHLGIDTYRQLHKS
jgi:hypothetical protein